MHVRLVEFRPVICAFAVVVDDIAAVIEERRVVRRCRVREVALHKPRHTFNISRRVDAAGVPDRMKHKGSALLDRFQRRGVEDGIEVHAIRRKAARGRQISPRLRRAFVRVDQGVKPWWDFVGCKRMSVLRLRQILTMRTQVILRQNGVPSRRGAPLGHGRSSFCSCDGRSPRFSRAVELRRCRARGSGRHPPVSIEAASVVTIVESLTYSYYL